MQALTSDIVRNSYGDGLFATMFATLTSGVFLTGLALHLGMDVRAIGLLAAVPFAATLFQLPVSVAIARRGNQKPLAVGHAFAGRLLWLPILAVGLTPLGSPTTRIAMVLGLVFVSHACISVSYVAWLSWMSDLVPASRLGSFFWTGITLCTNIMVIRMVPREDRAICISLHNIAAGLGAALAPVAAGLVAEGFRSHAMPLFARELSPLQMIFLASTAMRVMSLQLLRRVREPDAAPDLRVVRVLRNVRGLNSASGFNGILHPFVPAPRAAEKDPAGAPAGGRGRSDPSAVRSD